MPVSVDCLSSHESVFPVTVVQETPKNTGKFEKHVESIRIVPHLWCFLHLPVPVAFFLLADKFITRLKITLQTILFYIIVLLIQWRMKWSIEHTSWGIKSASFSWLFDSHESVFQVTEVREKSKNTGNFEKHVEITRISTWSSKFPTPTTCQSHSYQYITPKNHL